MGPWVSSSNQWLADSTRYTHPSWWTNHLDDTVNVYIFSYRILAAFGLGVHHVIACDDDDGKWRVAEWGPYDSNYGSCLKTYACTYIKGHKHCCLGHFRLGEVWEAINRSSNGREWSTDYNCNIWTENVASKLGWNVRCHWNCICVVSSTVTWRAG